MTNLLYDSLAANSSGSAPFASLEDGRMLSYADIFELTGQYANVLVAFGMVPGDRVAVQVPKSIEAVVLYLACVRAGAVFLPLNTAYTANEVDYFLDNAGASLFVCDPQRRSEMAPVAERSQARLETLGVSQSGSVAQAARRVPSDFDTVVCGPDDLAAILYTSGTTGRSKGAMLSHGNLLSNALTLREEWRFTANDVLLHALPIFHTHGLFVAINTVLLAGASMKFLESFKIDAVIGAIAESTAMMGVPTFYTRLLEDPRLSRDGVAHMRLFISGSAPLLAETHERFYERTGHRVLERYGMTETNMNTSNPYDGERRAGTVGFPLPGVSLRICNPETGRELSQGEVGVIEVRGPNVFSGYWQMPEKTAEEFRQDGFFITGDLGMVDQDGYVHIVGRAKDLIISGGFNIYPREIELLLDEQDGVQESAVIGVPHPDFGEGVVAIIVPQGGQIPDANRILLAIAGQVARFKQPKKLFAIDELPRNTMGKVQKNVLRQKFAQTFTVEV